MERRCKGCDTDKHYSDFYLKNNKPKGYYCKKCSGERYKKEYDPTYYQNNKEKHKEYYRKYKLENNRNEYFKEYREKNSDTIKEKQKELRENNKDLVSERKKEYYRNLSTDKKELLKIKKRENYHTNNQKEKKKEYVTEKLKTDPFFKMKFNIRSLIRNSVKRCFTEKSKKTIEILGCTFEEFKLHLESQFDENMCWENQGTYWHMDHIIPISSAQNEEEVYKLNHYTNFQPLYWEDNLRKSNKMS